MQEYDVTVIGAGPGGYVAAIRAAQRGAKVALIERELLGGTCLNWGCIPTKTLIAAAEVLTQARHASEFGVHISGEITADWPAMLARKEKIVGTLRQGIASLMKSNGIEVIPGTGAFVSRSEIEVTAADGARNRIATKSTIIASGSETIMPKFVPRADNILYSRSALEQPRLPESLIVLGAGVIGCEFACLYARLGSKVTLVEMLPEVLPMVDPDVARVVRANMEKLGVRVMTGATMSDIKADGRSVTCSANGETLAAECLLVCVGRRALSETVNAGAARIPLNDKGLIEVDDRCRTPVPGIYAIGDVAGTLQYAHRASAMGIVAANNATGKPDRHSDALVPGCIFTAPEIGTVGLTEAQAREKVPAIKVGKFFFSALGRAMVINEARGFCKIVADGATDQVLGVHIVGPHATDLIAEAATAMRLEITAAELGNAIHAHPTLAEAMMEAAHAVHDECIHLPPRHRKSG